MSTNKQTEQAQPSTSRTSTSAYYVPLLREHAESVREAMSIRRAERVAAGGRPATKADRVIRAALDSETPLQTTTLAAMCGVAQSYACRCLAEIAGLAGLDPVQDGRRLRKPRRKLAATDETGAGIGEAGAAEASSMAVAAESA